MAFIVPRWLLVETRFLDIIKRRRAFNLTTTSVESKNLVQTL